MLHRVALVALFLIAAALVALSLVWPQGQGAVSPPPFGRPLAAPERMITIAGQPVTSLRGDETPQTLAPAPASVPAPHP